LTLSLLALAPVLLGVFYVLTCIIDVYMVVIARVPSGEPMGGDELAYPVPRALVDGAIGVGLIALGLGVRHYLRRANPVS
jgi:hypothetical protein